MGQLDKMANALFGGKRAETQDGFAQDKTATIIGTAVTDSDSGAVMVELSSDVTNPEPVEIDGETYFEDASTAVELPTTQAVQAGDEVLVSVYGGTALKNSVVTGVVGSGDRVAADAEAARAIAEATGQHFWDDTNGAHVTEATREEWETQQTGPNSLWNSLGMLFRNGLNNLLALLSGGTITETFTAPSGAEWGFNTYLQAPAVSLAGVTVNGNPYTDSDCGVNGDRFYLHNTMQTVQAGDSIAVTYIAQPHMEIFDGQGNQASNIVALFASSVIKLAGGIFRFSGSSAATGSSGTIEIVTDDRPTARINLTADSYKSALLLEADSPTGNATIILDTNGSCLDLSYLSTVRIDYDDYLTTEIKKALTTGSGTITMTGGSTTNVHAVEQRGFMAQAAVIAFALNSALADGGEVVVGTIPSGYRPAMDTIVNPYVGNSTYAGKVYVGFRANGEVRVYNRTGASIPTSVRITASATYALA